MVIIIDDEKLKSIPESWTNFGSQHPHLSKNTEQMRQTVKTIQPSERLLYVQQREFAVVSPSDDKVDILGSEDATTCHIVVFRHTGSGAVALSHLDGSDTEGAVQGMLSGIQRLTIGSPEGGRIECSIVGGFLDDRCESGDVAEKLFMTLQNRMEHIHLKLVCSCEANDRISADGVHFPLIYGVAVDCKSGAIFPASFPDKGPDLALRSARHFVGSTRRHSANVYDPQRQLLVIEPFEFEPWDEVGLWLRQSDDFLLKYLSTSPDQEPPDFVANLRRTLEFIWRNPSLKGFFINGCPREYRKGRDGSWIPLYSESSSDSREWMMMTVWEWAMFLVILSIIYLAYLIVDSFSDHAPI